jgi:hypothetical protein
MTVKKGLLLYQGDKMLIVETLLFVQLMLESSEPYANFVRAVCIQKCLDFLWPNVWYLHVFV